ncbi:galactose mutarotase [Fulvivirga sp. M361]|uniref:aldose epimerase family protein n=1 Tax=Fulvivirga sp. M361 TaxID=2594266 RepID=UPI00117A5C3C|nr:aldose epimerase family protein [Fulvivirga sp. M361]TRX46396.1 galactose mutarotase [Fulvivirga sp. M361]
MKNSIENSSFGSLPDGTLLNLYTLTNASGIEMKVTDYGGIITSLKVPDRNGVFEDVVLGYDTIEQYLESSPYFGAVIGRYGNRIAKGKFLLDGIAYTLPINNGENHLHGGIRGFDKVVWAVEEIQKENGVGLKLMRTSPDMEEGYPGNLKVEVTYFLSNDNTVQFDYHGETDKKTIVNLTQHSYFNLSALKEDILGHELLLNANYFLPVDGSLIPTGELHPVSGTPFDFSSAKTIGKEIGLANVQLEYGGGYDHCWILNKGTEAMKFLGSLFESKSGRFMEVFTTEPAVQFYSGNFLDGNNIGKEGKSYGLRTGMCLETQHYPDSPNQSDFPSVELAPGEVYKTSTVYKFSVR